MAVMRSPKELLLERRRGHRVIVPSGLELRIRYLSPGMFVQRGDIPNLLMPLIVEMQNEGGAERIVERITQKAETDIESVLQDTRAWLDLTDYVLRQFIVYPKIIDNPALDNADEMSLAELDQDDKGWLMALVGLPARQLEIFCARQTELMERVLRGEDISDATEPSAEPITADSAVDGDSGT